VSIGKVESRRTMCAVRLKIQVKSDLRRNERETKHRTTAIYRIKEKRFAVQSAVGPTLSSALRPVHCSRRQTKPRLLSALVISWLPLPKLNRRLYLSTYLAPSAPLVSRFAFRLETCLGPRSLGPRATHARHFSSSRHSQLSERPANSVVFKKYLRGRAILNGLSGEKSLGLWQ